MHVASIVLVAGLTLVAYARRALGGGDVKLLMALALWMPVARLPPLLLLLAAFGVAQGLATLAVRRLAVPGGAFAPSLKGHMPYALSIALAGWTWVLMGGLR